MNIFDQPEFDPQWETVEDSPEGQVMLDCQKCGKIVRTAKYSAKLKILTWKCECGHTSHQENFEL